MLNRHSVQRYFFYRIAIFVLYILLQWPCALRAKDIPDSHNNRFSRHEFKGNTFTWFNGIDTDYVLDPIADTFVYMLFIYPYRIVMANEDSVHTEQISIYEPDGYLVKDYFNEVFRMEAPAVVDSVEALCFRHLVINDQGEIIFYEVKWCREKEYYEIEDKYLSDKIASIIERSGPWLNSKNGDKDRFTYIPSGFTIYLKPGLIDCDEQQ